MVVSSCINERNRFSAGERTPFHAYARNSEVEVGRTERLRLATLLGQGSAGGVAAPDGGHRGCWKVRKYLDDA